MARRFHAVIPATDQDSYNKVVKALSTRFGSQKQVEKFKAQLAMRKRKDGESAAELGDEIWRLVLRAYPQFNPKTQEQLALDAFQNAIDIALKVKCVEQACSTVEEAVRIVERYETLSFEEQGRRKSVRATCTAKDENELEKVLASLTQVLSRLMGETSPIASQNRMQHKRNTSDTTVDQRRAQLICFYCQKPGHVKADCRKLQYDQRKRSQSFTPACNRENKGNLNPSPQ